METLSLFPDLRPDLFQPEKLSEEDKRTAINKRSESKKRAEDKKRSENKEPGPTGKLADQVRPATHAGLPRFVDEDMRIAHRLSSDLLEQHRKISFRQRRRLARTRSSQNSPTRPSQHKVGNAICDHLLASLRRQIAEEGHETLH